MIRRVRTRRVRVPRPIAVLVLLAALVVPVLPSAASASAVRPTVTGAPKPACAKPAGHGRAMCYVLTRAESGPTHGRLTDESPAGYGPADLQSAYALPATDGAGPTVAVVDAYDDPIAESDLAVYRAQYGLPPCTTANGCFRKVDQYGQATAPTSDPTWATEISLDLDMVSAACPKCRLLLVEADTANFADLGQAVDEAVALGAKYVSNSYGTPYTTVPGSGEDPSESSLDAYYRHPGVAVVASSGDLGYGVAYPAASPYVTSVGGTSLTRDGSARGWTESAWRDGVDGTGSGCSRYEPKPAVQADTGCATRSVADVAAVADPYTGVATYDSYGALGWQVAGGTSVAAPLITAGYALAGTPAAGTYPNTYPYLHRAALHDVTAGGNRYGGCPQSYECAAGPGYDGPTGLGTPNGVGAFELGAHGTVTGSIDDARTRRPVGGAWVSAGGAATHTDAHGRYSLDVPAGSPELVVAAAGYRKGDRRISGADHRVSLALAPVSTTTVDDTLVDGSGHDWPLAATVAVNSVPGAPVFSHATTDPYTGRFSLHLPTGATYPLQVDAVEPGYAADAPPLTVGTRPVHATVAVPVDGYACAAPGYAAHDSASPQPFDGSTAPTGWTVTTARGDGWTFPDSGNLAGGGGYAQVVTTTTSTPTPSDTTLTSPAIDLTGTTAPELTFHWALTSSVGLATTTVDASTDGGLTWTTVLRQSGSDDHQTATVPLPPAAGQAGVRVRFHYVGSGPTWQVDDVAVGDHGCAATPGGLLAGRVTDANTRQPLDGATVTGAGSVSTAGGFYWMLAAPGSQSLSAADARYTTVTHRVDVTPNALVRNDFSLPAGQLRVSESSVRVDATVGDPVSRKITIRNDGTASAHVDVGDDPAGSTSANRPAAAAATPVRLVPGHYAPSRSTTHSGPAAPNPPPAAGWRPTADYPSAIYDNAVATDPATGVVYSVGGSSFPVVVTQDSLLSELASSYAYDPVSGAWSAIPDAPQPREAAAAGFVHGQLVVAGGWGRRTLEDTPMLPTADRYDPVHRTWSTGRVMPVPVANAGSGVLDGHLYVVGGCLTSGGWCGAASAAAQSYDPVHDRWQRLADYPQAESYLACGGVAGELVCTGGTDVAESTTTGASYAYDPGTNTWRRVADLPVDLWAMSAGVSGDQLLVTGGVTASSTKLTNQSFGYDPHHDTWTALPNAPQPVYRAGSACGLYTVGGLTASNSGPTAAADQLSGYTGCGRTPSWLSTPPSSIDIPAGHSVTLTVPVDAGRVRAQQPGTYSAHLPLRDDTPYSTTRPTITLHARAPRGWSEVTGTISGRPCTGRSQPLPHATVELTAGAADYSVTTDAAGHYTYWLDGADSPLTVAVGIDGWQPQAHSVSLRPGRTATLNASLSPVIPCGH